MNQSWRELIKSALEEIDDGLLIACTLSDFEMDVKFNTGYGIDEGEPFTAWTENYVLFPVVYDGSEWVGWAPRNPCAHKTQHQGGG